MSCLSIFQATLSIREPAALVVNLRGASGSWPPRQAVVCTAACSPALLREAGVPSGVQQGCSAGIRQAVLGRAVVGSGIPPLQDAAKLWPAGV